MYIPEIRQLLLENRCSNGSMMRSVIKSADFSPQEAVSIVCLMTYYLMPDHDVFTECMEIFKRFESSVKEDRLNEHKEDVDDDFTMDMALADDLQEKMKGYLGGSAAEEELEVAVDRLVDYFFEDGLPFDQRDQDGDSFLDIDIFGTENTNGDW